MRLIIATFALFFIPILSSAADNDKAVDATKVQNLFELQDPFKISIEEKKLMQSLVSEIQSNIVELSKLQAKVSGVDNFSITTLHLNALNQQEENCVCGTNSGGYSVCWCDPPGICRPALQLYKFP